MTHLIDMKAAAQVLKDMINYDVDAQKQSLLVSYLGALWVIRKSQVAIMEGFRVALDF
ncbi:hypothetical protein N9D47_02580 [Planktomarina temperata]|nr:hypothetical protein [Planktomarina temperata]